MKMKTKIDIIHNGKKLLDEYGPELACGGALVCLGMALYSAFKASKKVVEAEKDYQKEVEKIEQQEAAEDADVAGEAHPKNVRKARIARDIDYVLAYKWALLFGGASAFLMILSRQLSGTKIAGLTAALCMSEDKLKKLGGKVKDIIGEDELNKLKSEIRQEQAEATEKKEDVPWKTETGKKSVGTYNPEGTKKVFDATAYAMYEFDTEGHILDWNAAAMDYFAKHGELDYNKFRSLGGFEDCPLGYGTKWDKDNPYEGFTLEPMRYYDEWISAMVFKNEPSTASMR